MNEADTLAMSANNMFPMNAEMADRDGTDEDVPSPLEGKEEDVPPPTIG